MSKDKRIARLEDVNRRLKQKLLTAKCGGGG